MSRRGSSLFAQGGAMPGAATGAPAAPPGGAKRQSVVLQPMAGGIGLVDFDSDYESEEEEVPQSSQAPNNPPGTGTGGPNHRPMVGGFAAAAYEAARAYHYAAQEKKKSTGSKKPMRPGDQS